MVILIFIILESLNVIILYFFPNSKLGNGVGVFNGWFELKEKENLRPFIEYMVNWVAGTKLIFIFLLIIILLKGTSEIKYFSILSMIFSISTYFWKLDPLLKKLDLINELTPKGYSKKLFYMIFGILCIFLSSLILF